MPMRSAASRTPPTRWSDAARQALRQLGLLHMEDAETLCVRLGPLARRALVRLFHIRPGGRPWDSLAAAESAAPIRTRDSQRRRTRERSRRRSRTKRRAHRTTRRAFNGASKGSKNLMPRCDACAPRWIGCHTLLPNRLTHGGIRASARVPGSTNLQRPQDNRRVPRAFAARQGAPDEC